MSSRILISTLIVGLALGPLSLPSAPAAKKSSKAAASKKKKHSSLRSKRLTRAFVASRDLRPMAQQLLQNRTPAAYVGVERYALAHSKSDAGSLAWLAIGYARMLDGEYAKAVESLSKARLHAGELADYVDYLLASSYAEIDRSQDAVKTLKDFATRYPDSLLIRDARVALARGLIATGKAQEALSLLEAARTPVRPDIELTLARAWIAAGEKERAVEALYRIFYTMPSAAEADAADAELQILAKEGPVTPPSTDLRRTRADLLLQSRRSTDAVPEYQALLQQASGADVRPLQMALAVALYRSGKSKDADDLLAHMDDLPDDVNAQRLFYQLDIARPDPDKVNDLIVRLRDTAPNSAWFQEGLLSAGNMYLLKNEFESALGLYSELSTRFPSGKYGAYATWKTAWLQLRLNRLSEAKNSVERYLELYPNGSELGSALYWRGRIAEDEKELPAARAYYSKLNERFQNSYYAELGRQRLQEIGSDGEKSDDPLLAKIAMPQPSSRIEFTAPADDLGVQKSKLLENAGLVDFAVRELQQAAGAKSDWLPAEMARIYGEAGIYHRALQTVKRAVPGYYSFQLADLPRPFWEYLFPKAYWQDLRRYATSNGLDPFLVASLIRQESEFNAGAQSRANAMGLMQILPGTGKKLAKQLKIKGFDNSYLLDPSYNLQMGTRYFRELLKRYDGRLEYALAAYNAGPDRVDEWKKGTYRDMPEFVESIPFTETREYVQAIVRNVALYQRLYQSP